MFHTGLNVKYHNQKDIGTIVSMLHYPDYVQVRYESDQFPVNISPLDLVIA